MKLLESVELGGGAFVSLEEIKALAKHAKAFYVYEKEDKWWVRFRIAREYRADESEAEHPQITASDGTQRIELTLSTDDGWYIRVHRGDFKFNRKVLAYLNRKNISVEGNVAAVLARNL